MRRGKQLIQKLLASILSLALVLTGVIPQGMSFVQAAGQTEDGLILYYDFDLQNSFATEINDVSGNLNSGHLRRVSGSVEGSYSIDNVNIYGKKVKALSLPGGADGSYLQLPDGILNGKNAVTISMWVKLTTDTGYQRIWDFGTGTDKYMYLLSDGGNEGFEGYASAITVNGWNNEKGISKGPDKNIDKNRWVLTTVVMDGAKMSLYENGEQIKETKDTGLTVNALENTTNNYIGYGQFGDAPTKGQFAEVKIYNKALTAAQIKEMYYVDDAGIVSADEGDLDLGDTSSVTEDIDLPEKGVNGSDITWSSENSAVVIEGNKLAKVTRPAKGQENVSGTITAEITYNQAKAVKKFDVTVIAEYTEQQILDHDAEAIRKSLGDLTAIMKDFELPSAGEWGSTVTWESANPAIKIENGVAKVTRPEVGAQNAVGKLKAVLTSGTEKKTLELDTTVIAKREAATIKDVEEINVTTLKGKSPVLPNYVKVTYSDNTTNKLKTIWPELIEESKYAAAGTFTVEGTIVGETKKITANVTVLDQAEEAKTAVSQSFDLNDISLDKIGENGSILTQNRDRDIEYLKLLDNKRMLYNFYKTFGQTEKIKDVEPMGGWDEPTGLLRGHSTGHYMSALALAYASTGDAEIKAKLDEMVHELRELQKLSKGDPKAFVSKGVDQSLWSTNPEEWGEGFVSAYSADQFALLEKYTPYAQIWAPYYTLHKLMAGFIDAYTYTGNQEALDTAKALGKWAYNRLSGCTQEQLTKMWDMYIAGEFGGFNESMAQLYVYTGDEDFLKGAKLFDNTKFFNNLAKNVDDIQKRHANQHIPQIIGAMEMYEATVKKGTPEVYYFDIAQNFWKMVVSRYAYSIGGVGTGEKFTDPYQQANSIAGTTNCETCAAYNLLKLTKMLNNYDPDNAEYMDYYERTLYNQILASQTPNVTSDMHNGTTYMLPIGPGSTRSYGGDYDSFSCCHGTGMENHVKYQEAAYAKTADTLYVGLYLPTTLTWEEKGVKVVQETTFPSDSTKLTVSALEGKTAQEFTMKLRVPYWATKGFDVKVNGTAQNIKAETSSYVTLEGIKAGDVIEITMPWDLHLDKTPDKIGKSTVASVMYGPFVMAAQNESTDWKTLVLSSNLSDSIKIGTNEKNGFPTLTANGLNFAPMFAPEYATQAYHAYFKVITDDDGGNWYEVKLTNNTPKNGTFSADADMVKEGGSLVITIAPNEGYMVKNLTVNGVKVDVGNATSYTIENVKENLVIEGSFRLINPPTPDPEHLEYSAEVSSDYTAGWENLDGIKTDWEPTKSKDGTNKGWGNYAQAAGSEHYVQYDWDQEVKMNRFDIFWYDDAGGTRIPASLKIMYLAADGTWKEANMTTKFEDILELDKYNTILFDEISTTAVKLVLTVREDAAANGIYRWKVSHKSSEKPIEADKSLLKTAIDSAKKKVEKEYTAASWKRLKEALDKATKVYDNKTAIQDEVDNAVQDLNAAIRNLVKVTVPPVSTVKPGKPSSVKATWTGKKNIKITWKKASNADKYLVYRSYKKSSGYKKIASVKKTKTSYTDTKASAGKTVYYKVIAYKGTTKGSFSKVASAFKLKAASKLKVKAKKRNVTVSFAKVTKASGYEIYRSNKSKGKYKKVATIKAGKAKTVKKTFKKMKKGTYYFKVRVYKTSGKKKIYTDYTKVVKIKVK